MPERRYQMKENFDQFIGIPWKFNGRDKEGLDCVGMCAYIYDYFGWKQTWTDGKPIEEGWYKTQPLRMLLWLRRNFIPTKDRNLLKTGDIILFKISGEHHLGIYEKYGQFLTIMPPSHREFGGTSFRARLNQYESAVVSYYRR
jgi:cell wall-associated NlpC family hydrolase